MSTFSPNSSSYNGGGSLTKSRNSGSSQSSGFGDQQNKKGVHTASIIASDQENSSRSGQTEPNTNDHVIAHAAESLHLEGNRCQDGANINNGFSEATINNAPIQRCVV